jgi:polyketide synthase 5
LVATAVATGLPVRGVLHAAAVVEDATLTTITDELIERDWAPKVYGAWNLHTATAEQPLDWFCAFSSAAALVGSPGQGAYAAANSWLDAFTLWRRNQGLPATAIAWGAWAQIGIERATALAEGTDMAIAPEEGAYALQALLRHDRAYTGYAPFTGEPWLTAFAQRSPFAEAFRSTGQNAAGTSKLRAGLDELPPDEWPTRLRRLISDQVSLILRRSIDPDRPLSEYGLDSLGALELRTRIAAETGIRLTSGDIATTTVRDLAGLLCEKLAPAKAASFNGRASNGDARPDNRLAVTDYAMFAGHRATGQKVVIQVVWVYEHAIDFDGLRRFHHNLGYGLLGRRIERSPLPFARHRWVLERGPSDIDIAECARPRGELSDWIDERSQLPIDPEWGPGWHLGVLPLTDGSTAVSLVVSHYLIDGLGLDASIADAVLGNTRDLGYPPPRSRTRLHAVVQDARQTAQDAPEVARALVAAAKLARKQARRRHDTAPSPAPRPVTLRGGDGDDAVVVPAITIHIDLDEWDARAKALSGTRSTLVAGLAAKLGERMGRRRAGDGAVTLHLPMSDRTEGDTRAMTVSYTIVSVDPTRVTTDLRDVGAAINQAPRTLRETPDESPILWLASFTPKRAWKRMADTLAADPDLPVFCSYLGDTHSAICRLDGTDAERAYARAPGQCVTRRWLERIGGQMNLLSGRIGGKIFITVAAYQPGAKNTKPALRELAAHTLAEFDLTGDID